MSTQERQEAQGDALTQQLLASVFMSIGAAVAIIALDGRFIASNPIFAKLLRYGARRLDGIRFWDLIDEEDGKIAAKVAAQAGGSETPYEADAQMMLGDGSTALMHLTVTTADQPQFKRFRIITLHDAGSNTSRDAETSPAEDVIVAGKIQLVGLDLVKAALGARWPAHAERAMNVAETILRRRLASKDVFSRTRDQGFVICFAEGNEQEAAFRAATIAREIRSRLIGDGDDPANSSVTAITQSIPIGDADRENGRALMSALENRLDAARAEAERIARAELSIAMAGATLEPEQLFDSVGKPVPIVFVGLPQDVQDQIDIAVATLPSLDGVDADQDVLKLTLTVEAALADIAARRSGVYLLPLDFALFTHRKRQSRYIEICRKLQESVRLKIMFMLSNVPKNVSQNRLSEVMRLLKPFGKGVGMLLDEAELVPTDLAQYRIPLVALSAEEILATARTSPPKLARLLRQLQLNGARLIARQVHGETERNTVTGLNADLVSFATGNSAEQVLQAPVADEEAMMSAAYAAAVKGGPVACLVTNIRKPDNPIASCNAVFTEISGYTTAEAIGRNWRFLQGPDTDPQTIADIRKAAETGTAIRREMLLYRKDGSQLWADIAISPVHDAAGTLIGIVGLMNDITALRRSEASRRDLTKFITNLSDTIPGFIFQRVVTNDGQLSYSYISPSFHRLIGVTAGDPDANAVDRWVHPADREAVVIAAGKSAEELSLLSIEYRIVGKNNVIRWIRSTAQPLRSANGNIVWNGVGVDITSEKSAEGRLTQLAGYDHLTGLLNRQEFRNQLSGHIIKVQAEGGKFAVLSVDIADFQTVNDAFGTTVGDTVLRIVGDRIAKFPGAKLVARIGGNEFAALFDIDDDTSVLDLARPLRQEIVKPIDVDDRRIVTYSYIGAALYPENAVEPGGDPHQIAARLTKAVDIALFMAKRAGPGACHAYTPEDDDGIRNRAILQQSLVEAYDSRQFVLHYQPVVDLESGRILGAEALIRWNHPELGLQRPDRFIPLVEKMGLIVPLGAWVLEEVLRNLRDWEATGLGRPKIAVNVTAAQLQHPEALAELRRHIVESGSNPTQIEIELTESEFIDPTPGMLRNLEALRELGVTVAIDDFGTGYSSFRYLRSLPVDKLKIDQSFVRHMTPESSDEAIVRGMISIGRDLGLTVVVEGVETSGQRDILLLEGCRVGQGYFYSMPVTAEDFAWMLAENLELPISRSASKVPDDAARRHHAGA
jgi:diguanylate cyclase (GGDEF)-like protein/PAS domain S-box-containing protein